MGSVRIQISEHFVNICRSGQTPLSKTFDVRWKCLHSPALVQDITHFFPGSTEDTTYDGINIQSRKECLIYYRVYSMRKENPRVVSAVSLV